jgi:molybdenum cofactor synthesis domain-containing protein
MDTVFDICGVLFSVHPNTNIILPQRSIVPLTLRHPPPSTMTEVSTEEHPMVAVPTAVRIVITEVCRLLHAQRGASSYVETIAVQASDPNVWKQLYGRILEQDVVMSPPGYPPYTASIMDGYAFAIDDIASTLDGLPSHSTWTHVVRDKIYAGAHVKQTTNESYLSDSIHNDDEDDIQSTTSSKMQFHDYSHLPAAYYVTTGAMLPDHCDCVVPVEDVRVQVMEENAGSSATLISIPSAARVRNKWIRAPGCDIPAGTLLLQRKTRLDSVAIGLLLQSGIASVQVRRKVTVGVLSTGSELRMSSSSSSSHDPAHAPPGTIPDINRPVLLSLLHSYAHLNVLDLQIVRDDDPVEDMLRVVTSAIKQCDVVLSTGGISKGETDFVESLLMQKLPSAWQMTGHPQLHFGRLHMKPGKPTTFITLPKEDQGTCFWFALPGNPVSAYVCSHLLVWPCVHLLAHGPRDASFEDNTNPEKDDDDLWIQAMVSQALVHTEIERVELTQDVKLDVERPEYHRVRFIPSSSPDHATIRQVKSTGVQQSSRFLSLQHAEGLVLLPQGTKEKPMAKAGEQYLLLRLDGGNMTTPVHLSHHLRVEELSPVPAPPLPLEESVKEVAPLVPPTPVSQKEPLSIGIIQLSPAIENGFQFQAVVMQDDIVEDTAVMAERIEQEFIRRVEVAMTGSKSGPVQVVASQIYTGPVDRFYATLIHGMIPDAPEPGVDVWVVIAKGNFQKHRGAYHHHMMLAHQLRKNLSKVATSMALQARRGAAKQDPIVGALFEIVIGYVDIAKPNSANDTVSSSPTEESNGSLLILLPEEGLDLGLQNVRGLLKHAVRVARGTNTGNPSALKASNNSDDVEQASRIQ